MQVVSVRYYVNISKTKRTERNKKKEKINILTIYDVFGTNAYILKITRKEKVIGYIKRNFVFQQNIMFQILSVPAFQYRTFDYEIDY